MTASRSPGAVYWGACVFSSHVLIAEALTRGRVLGLPSVCPSTQKILRTFLDGTVDFPKVRPSIHGMIPAQDSRSTVSVRLDWRLLQKDEDLPPLRKVGPTHKRRDNFLAHSVFFACSSYPAGFVWCVKVLASAGRSRNTKPVVGRQRRK